MAQRLDITFILVAADRILINTDADPRNAKDIYIYNKEGLLHLAISFDTSSGKKLAVSSY
jgi:hypothetical protein